MEQSALMKIEWSKERGNEQTLRSVRPCAGAGRVVGGKMSVRK